MLQDNGKVVGDGIGPRGAVAAGFGAPGAAVLVGHPTDFGGHEVVCQPICKTDDPDDYSTHDGATCAKTAWSPQKSLAISNSAVPQIICSSYFIGDLLASVV